MAGEHMEQRVITAGYREAFQRELEHFHAAITRGEPLRTPGEEGLADTRWLSDIVIQAARQA